DIARIYFYMSEKYNINLSKQERQMMEAWDKLDPVDEWEKERIQRIKKYQ
ncbi:MAG: deoxyribonuclease I, partial [Erysipelotrichia bacterium]|nr:deoxyribonuclease I [Erysipelotrichia bacterium]